MKQFFTLPRVLNGACALNAILAIAVLMTEVKHGDGAGTTPVVLTLSGAYMFVVCVLLAIIFHKASQWFATGKLEFDTDKWSVSEGSFLSPGFAFGALALLAGLDGKWLICSISLVPTIVFMGLAAIKWNSLNNHSTPRGYNPRQNRY